MNRRQHNYSDGSDSESKSRNIRRSPKPNKKQQWALMTDRARRDAEREMNEGYQSIIETYERQHNELNHRQPWTNDRLSSSAATTATIIDPPPDMTVTHINQLKDLYDGFGNETAFSQFQTSAEWLTTHSLKAMKLTLKDLVNRGKMIRSTLNNETGKVQQRLQFEASDIANFETRIHCAIQSFSKRIKWMLQGSRKTFGTIHGNNVGLLVDCSEACFGFGRRTPLIQALTLLLEEQLSVKRGLYVASFGSDVEPLWTSGIVRIVNDKIVDEARQWIDTLNSFGGTNLLAALKHIFTIENLNTVCVVVGSLPDQEQNALLSYVEQLSLGRSVRLYTVSYECAHHQTNAILQKLAEVTDGSYHCYNSSSEDQIYTSTNIVAILDEIRACQDILNRITQMKLGYLGTALVTITNKLAQHVSQLPAHRFFPRPVGHDLPLNLEMPSFTPLTSADWLAKHGLKAKGLDLYQILAPNAYSYLEEFIPVIRKTVQSQVHSRAMTQFQWHDGTVKNIHVDMSMLFEYQKQLGAVVKLYEKRIDWLSCASRKNFSSVSENNLIFVVDVSVFNSNHIIHIQDTLRHVLQEQMCNKQYFNIIAFGEVINMWKPSMVKVTGEMLQEAWRWILELQCSGGRNILGALRRAFECDDLSSTVDVEGIYLLTSGVPDQPADVCNSYLEEVSAGRSVKLHAILFSVDDRDLGIGGVPSGNVTNGGTMGQINGAGGMTLGAVDSDGSILPCRYASITQTAQVLRQMAHSTPGGRFLWYRETGIIDSDDVSSLSLEIEKALNFSKKCQMLVESVKKKDSLDQKYLEMMPDGERSGNSGQTSTPPPKPLQPPKQTALSQARIEMAAEKDKDNVPKALAYKDGQTYKQRRPTSAGPGATDPIARVKGSKGPKVEQAFFYTGNKNDIGAVYRAYQTKPMSSGSKGIPNIRISDKEEQVTTKTWLRQFSLSKLHLNLNKLALGGSSRHQHVLGHVSEHVGSINKVVDAKACNIFPTVNVSGTLRHLLLTPVQLIEFQQQIQHVLTRYLQRLQWLLAGSRRVFGTVVEKNCILLVDTSGSMDERMDELKRELIALVWEQLHKHNVKFNLIAFSRSCISWNSGLVESTEENCHDAARWITELRADGNTCTLEALQLAFSQYCNLSEVTTGGVGLYLLTDGKPDTSMSMVLNKVDELNANKRIAIHTISFNCPDSMANEFLKTLANNNDGRYHCVVQRHAADGGFDAHLFAHQLIESNFSDPQHPAMPQLFGDDVVRLSQEIEKARRYLAQSRTYLEVYDDLKKAQQPAHDCFTVGPCTRPRPVSAVR